jgi:hypothetical protein
MGVEQAPSGRATKESLSRTVVAALPVAILLPFVCAIALIVGAGSGPRMSSSALFAVLASLTLFGFVAVTRVRRPRAGVLAACHALAWAPCLIASVWQKIDEAIVSRPMRGCGTGLMAFLMLVVPLGAIVLLALGTAAGLLFVRRTTDRALRSVAFGASGLALVAFAFAAMRMARPDPDTYLASLPQVAEVHAGAGATIAGRVYRYDLGEPAPAIAQRTMEGGEASAAALARAAHMRLM